MSETGQTLEQMEMRAIILMNLYNYEAKSLALVAAGMEGTIAALRAEVERLTAERDALLAAAEGAWPGIMSSCMYDAMTRATNDGKPDSWRDYLPDWVKQIRIAIANAKGYRP